MTNNCICQNDKHLSNAKTRSFAVFLCMNYLYLLVDRLASFSGIFHCKRKRCKRIIERWFDVNVVKQIFASHEFENVDQTCQTVGQSKMSKTRRNGKTKAQKCYRMKHIIVACFCHHRIIATHKTLNSKLLSFFFCWCAFCCHETSSKRRSEVGWISDECPLRRSNIFGLPNSSIQCLLFRSCHRKPGIFCMSLVVCVARVCIQRRIDSMMLNHCEHGASHVGYVE